LKCSKKKEENPLLQRGKENFKRNETMNGSELSCRKVNRENKPKHPPHPGEELLSGCPK